MQPRRRAAGFTLLEMAVVLLLIGMAAALVAPVLLRVNPGRSGFEELIATARETAVRRGEVLYLRVGISGQWSLDAATSTSTTEALATGRVESVVGAPLTLMLAPNGSCMFDVATVTRGTSIRLDPLTCEVQPSTPRPGDRAGTS
jgi:general secretion pathway protein H